MAIAWIVEQHVCGSEYSHGPYRDATAALKARADIEEPTTLYVATDSRSAVVELCEWAGPRAVPAWELPAVLDTLTRLEAQRRMDAARED